MSLTLPEQIRERAYHIWEREGRPEGRDAEHWIVAERELRREVVPVAAPPRKRARKQTAAAPAPARRKALDAPKMTAGSDTKAVRPARRSAAKATPAPV